MAVNYRGYLFNLLAPYARGAVLEIGAGIGNMTEMLVRRTPNPVESICCVEAEGPCVEILRDKFRDASVKMDFIHGFFPEAAPKGRLFDLAFHYNVLEHVDDDVATLAACRDLLKPGGMMFAFVPAFQMLYGSMDRQLRHHRRYNKPQLLQLVRDAGFEVVKARYCNLVGFFGWFYNNRILKIEEQKAGQIWAFDKLVLPAQSWLEGLCEPPVGQNLYVAAKRI